MLGLGGDPTPGMVESVQALAKEFGDFSHDVQSAWSALNSFGGDATALSWVGQTADAFKAAFGPLPGRLQKLYVSYGEASDALTAYWLEDSSTIIYSCAICFEDLPADSPDLVRITVDKPGSEAYQQLFVHRDQFVACLDSRVDLGEILEP